MARIRATSSEAVRHRGALRAKANTVSQTGIPNGAFGGKPAAAVAAYNLAIEINSVRSDYVSVLFQSAEQIVELCGRREEEDTTGAGVFAGGG